MIYICLLLVLVQVQVQSTKIEKHGYIVHKNIDKEPYTSKDENIFIPICVIAMVIGGIYICIIYGENDEKAIYSIASLFTIFMLIFWLVYGLFVNDNITKLYYKSGKYTLKNLTINNYNCSQLNCICKEYYGDIPCKNVINDFSLNVKNITCGNGYYCCRSSKVCQSWSTSTGSCNSYSWICDGFTLDRLCVINYGICKNISYKYDITYKDVLYYENNINILCDYNNKTCENYYTNNYINTSAINFAEWDPSLNTFLNVNLGVLIPAIIFGLIIPLSLFILALTCGIYHNIKGIKISSFKT